MNAAPAPDEQEIRPTKPVAMMAALSMAMLWASQPPLALWPLAFVALVPLIKLIQFSKRLQRRDVAVIWLFSAVYWMLSLQGLRHAHPLMFLPWLALSAYLGLYPVAFVLSSRRLLARRFAGFQLPMMIAIPMIWVVLECVRNYLLTGISVLMLGHALADVPSLIQIADLFGTYGVGFVVVSVNVAISSLIGWPRCSAVEPRRRRILSTVTAVGLLVATYGYGQYRLSEPVGDDLATFVLLQRNEQVDYGMPIERETETFRNYAQHAIAAVAAAGKQVDAVVWPESMLTGGSPWMEVGERLVVPEEAGMNESAFRLAVEDRQRYNVERARYVGQMMVDAASQERPPDLIGGCGVVRYAELPESYSGVVHVDGRGNVIDWYGKTHLVMFGEYIPILPWIPILHRLVPPELGLSRGTGPQRLQVGETIVSPNICIETAVERVTVRQIDAFDDQPSADVVVTVTNDGWFDDSAVVDHHLRCVQLVAVGIRRPILSSANNGPTAWINDRGEIVGEVAKGENGWIIATPTKSDRRSLYVRLEDWPVRLLTLLTVIMLFIPVGMIGNQGQGDA